MNPDFVIKDSVLKQYKGAGGDVVIPDGVTELDFESFRFCEGLKTVKSSDCTVSETFISPDIFVSSSLSNSSRTRIDFSRYRGSIARKW